MSFPRLFSIYLLFFFFLFFKIDILFCINISTNFVLHLVKFISNIIVFALYYSLRLFNKLEKITFTYKCDRSEYITLILSTKYFLIFYVALISQQTTHDILKFSNFILKYFSINLVFLFGCSIPMEEALALYYAMND